MNAQFFNTKRVHHGMLRVMRRPLAYFGLTPARFDMLFALGPYRECASMLQSDLRRMLGVSASVVSRMLRALEGLGLVTRLRADGRQLMVYLTETGRRRAQQAFRSLCRPAQRLLEEAITPSGRWWDREAAFLATCTFEDFLRALRRAFFDTATFYYPWHPDD